MTDDLMVDEGNGSGQRLLGCALVVTALTLWPWGLGDPPREETIFLDGQRLAQVLALQVFLLFTGLNLVFRRVRAQAAWLRALGLLAIGAGIAGNPWLVGMLAGGDGSIDGLRTHAILLALQSACVFGGFALVAGWIRPGRTSIRVLGVSTATVLLVAASFGGLYWGLALYGKGHSHTVLVPSELEKVTPEQRQWTRDFYERSLKAALDNGWFDFETAMAQGFQADPVNRTHFPNPEYLFDDVVFDPERPEWLVYHDTPDGKVLMALMFFTRELEAEGPTPAGPLALWHFHPYWQPRCAIGELWTVGKPDEQGRCAEGELVERTPEMFHVWFIDHPLSRFTEMKIVSDYWQDVGFDIRWYHPIFVHFTIALLTIAVLLDVGGLLTKKRELHFAAWVNLLLAALLTVGTVSTGMVAEVFSKPTVAGHWTLDTHKLYATGTAAVLLVLVVWRAALRGSFPGKGGLLFVLIGLLGVGFVSGAGYYGGAMVYEHGTAVRALDEFARETYWEKVEREYLPRSREVIERIARTRVPQPEN